MSAKGKQDSSEISGALRRFAWSGRGKIPQIMDREKESGVIARSKKGTSRERSRRGREREV